MPSSRLSTACQLEPQAVGMTENLGPVREALLGWRAGPRGASGAGDGLKYKYNGDIYDIDDLDQWSHYSSFWLTKLVKGANLFNFLALFLAAVNMEYNDALQLDRHAGDGGCIARV